MRNQTISEVKPKNYTFLPNLSSYALSECNIESDMCEESGRGLLLYIKYSLDYNVLDKNCLVTVE
jgi:hypothetical protein